MITDEIRQKIQQVKQKRLLGGNPLLEDPPIEIAEQGINAIREYFCQKQAEKDQRI